MSSKNKYEHSIEYWSARRNFIVTDIGKWVGGEDVTVRGASLLNDIFDNLSYMQLHVLNVTGRVITKELSVWLENNFMTMSYPDSRIWCNQVGAICGTTGTTPSAAAVAGSISADSRIYGGSQTSLHAMNFLKKAFLENVSGKSIVEIVEALPKKQEKPAIMGFARPVDSKDERIEPHRKMTKRLGFEVGEYMQLANSIDAYVSSKYKLGINIGGYTAAFMLDQGFTGKEVYGIKGLCVHSGVMACYQDNSENPENSFLPKKCEDVKYTGVAPREVI